MRSSHFLPERVKRFAAAGLLVVAALLLPAMAQTASAQTVAGGDFDICDYCGTLEGNTARLRGRAGFGTNEGIFVLINAADGSQDVDRDGFTPGFNFSNLFVADTTDFLNVEDPERSIGVQNFVLVDFLNPLKNGFQNQVRFLVNIPPGTPAGIYRGVITIRDSVAVVAANPNGEALRVDQYFIEIEVLANRAIGLVEADTAAELDSLVLRGRPGQTVSGVVRVANLGNVEISNARLEATDLVATSGTGLRIRREQISFSPTLLTAVGLGDTSRVVVTVRIPLGILAGSYTGELIVQAEGVEGRRVPLTVIVTTPGDIVFENNPVYGRNGDVATIIFNADAGSRWVMRIFDMQAIVAFKAEDVVFAGTPTGPVQIRGDEAVRYTWNLKNNRGENVAAGMYLVVIEATQAGERRQLRSKLMVIR